jgi:hypothetical protein
MYHGLSIAEHIMELPTCPVCAQGRLVPLSHEHRTYAMWVCTTRQCAYVISTSYGWDSCYKGLFGREGKETDLTRFS